MNRANKQPPVILQALATIAYLIIMQLFLILVVRIITGLWKVMSLTTEDWFGLIMIIILLLSLAGCYPHYGYC